VISCGLDPRCPAPYAMASTIAFSVALGRIAAAVFFASGR
jgi:hypothetical protein